jgi:hypothetical protein
MHVGIFSAKVPPLKPIHGAKVALLSMPEPKFGKKLL